MTAHESGARGSARQPQGDFGRGKDHAPLGSNDDWNRQQEQVGAYRDAESPDEEKAVVQRERPASTRKPGGSDSAKRSKGAG
jgi:hypothetical protein